MLQIVLVCLVGVPKTLQMGHYPHWKNFWEYHGSTKSNEGIYNPRHLHPTRGEIFGSKYHPATSHSPIKRFGGDSHYHSGNVQMNHPMSTSTKCLLNLYSKPSMTGRSREYCTSSTHPVNYPSTRKSTCDYFTPKHFQVTRNNNIFNSHHYGRLESVLPAQTDCSLPYFSGTGLSGKDVAFRIGSPAEDYSYDDFERKSYCKRSYCGPCAYVDQSSLGSYPPIQNTYTNPSLLSQFYSEPNEDFRAIDPFCPTRLPKRLVQDVPYCDASKTDDKSHDLDRMHQKENDHKQLKPDSSACLSDFSNDVDIKTVHCLCKCLKDQDCHHHESHRRTDDISVESKSNHKDSHDKNSEENSDVDIKTLNCLCKCLKDEDCCYPGTHRQSDDKSHDSDRMHRRENDYKQFKPDWSACSSDCSNDDEFRTVKCLRKCLNDKDCRHHESHRRSDDISVESESNHNHSHDKNSGENSDECEASFAELFKEPQTKGFLPINDCAKSETEPPTTVEELKTTTEYPSETEAATTTEEPNTTTEYPSETEAAEYPSETEAEKPDNASDSENPSKSSELADDASSYSKSSSYSSSSSYSYSSSGAP